MLSQSNTGYLQRSAVRFLKLQKQEPLHVINYDNCYSKIFLT